MLDLALALSLRAGHETQLTAITMSTISADVNIGKQAVLCLSDMHTLLALAQVISWHLLVVYVSSWYSLFFNVDSMIQWDQTLCHVLKGIVHKKKSTFLKILLHAF